MAVKSVWLIAKVGQRVIVLRVAAGKKGQEDVQGWLMKERKVMGSKGARRE